jgi:gag-polypeptide of LTR copia-type
MQLTSMAQEEFKMQVQVPKLSLDGSNWVIYHDRLKWAMQTNSFNTHVSDTSPTQAYTTLGVIGGLTPDAHWEKEENTIKQVLRLMLPDTAFNRIKALANVDNAWEILRCIYEERSKALVADLIRRFQNKHCDEDEIVRLHFEYLADLCEQLEAMGKSVTDKDYTDMLLTLLPASYDGAVSSISMSVCLGSKVLTAEIFEQLILDKAERRQVKDRYAESRDEAQATDSGKRKGKDKSKDKKKAECYNCRKTRHYKSKCWAKGGGKEGQGPWRGKGVRDNAALAVEQSEEPKTWVAIEEIEESDLTSNPGDIVAAAGCSPVRLDPGHG